MKTMKTMKTMKARIAVTLSALAVLVAIAGLCVLASGCATFSSSGGAAEEPIRVPEGKALAAELRALEKQVAQEEGRGKKLLTKVSRFSPRGVYIVVDTGSNKLYLMDGERILRTASCSTGSGSRLVDIAGKRVWVFNTPRGEFEVQRKVVKPVWTKPDWAFIEEGQPLPRDAAERVDTYSLGDYALYLGDGYLIHGTLYQRLLGRSVTHGCVRLGDEDLEAVWKAAGIGTRVYIF